LREIRRILRDHGHLVIMCRNVAKVRNFFRRMLGWSDVIEIFVRPESEIRVLLNKKVSGRGGDYFYDPPFERWRSPRDLFIGLINHSFRY